MRKCADELMRPSFQPNKPNKPNTPDRQKGRNGRDRRDRRNRRDRRDRRNDSTDILQGSPEIFPKLENVSYCLERYFCYNEIVKIIGEGKCQK